MITFLLPMIWFSSVAFFKPSSVNDGPLLCVDRHFTPRSSSRLRTSLAVSAVQFRYGA